MKKTMKLIRQFVLIVAILTLAAVYARAETACKAASAQEILNAVTAFNINPDFTPLTVEILKKGENCFTGRIVECPADKSAGKTCRVKDNEYVFSYDYSVLNNNVTSEIQTFAPGNTIRVSITKIPSENPENIILLPAQLWVVKTPRDTYIEETFHRKSTLDRLKSFFNNFGI